MECGLKFWYSGIFKFFSIIMVEEFCDIGIIVFWLWFGIFIVYILVVMYRVRRGFCLDELLLVVDVVYFGCLLLSFVVFFVIFLVIVF